MIPAVLAIKARKKR
ncbi:hypothetical protein ACUODJ_26860 [Escherichia sp. HC-CC]